MTENRLVVPESILHHIRRMRYDGIERIDYYLSREISHPTDGYTATIPLVRMPHGNPSRGLSVDEDPEFIRTLAKYLDSDQENSAVLLHFHPLKGPSSPDARLMVERFRQNNRLSRYGIFVGPDGPTIYETDGNDVFPIRSKVGTTPLTPEIRDLQQKVVREFARIMSSRR